MVVNAESWGVSKNSKLYKTWRDDELWRMLSIHIPFQKFNLIQITGKLHLDESLKNINFIKRTKNDKFERIIMAKS